MPRLLDGRGGWKGNWGLIGIRRVSENLKDNRVDYRGIEAFGDLRILPLGSFKKWCLRM